MSKITMNLENLGLGNLSGMDIYAKQDRYLSKQSSGSDDDFDNKVAFKEKDFLLDKTIQCPVCGKKFKTKIVNPDIIKYDEPDEDLRPRYKGVDPLKYDAIVCTNCGYAALSMFFNSITSTYSKVIRDSISANFVNTFKDEDTYSYEDAVLRHKLVLLNAVMKRAKDSEKAYTCLKISWLLREKALTVSRSDMGVGTKLYELKKEEIEFMAKAYEGFVNACNSEVFPICGMDKPTCMFMMAQMARMIGKRKEAIKLVNDLLKHRSINEKIKSRALDLKKSLEE